MIILYKTSLKILVSMFKPGAEFMYISSFAMYYGHNPDAIKKWYLTRKCTCEKSSSAHFLITDGNKI